MEIHIHIHHTGDEDISYKFDKILEQQGVIMSAVEDLKAELVAANEATNEVAGDLDDLLSRLEGGLSAEEAATVQAQVTELKTKLQEVAAKHTPGSTV